MEMEEWDNWWIFESLKGKNQFMIFGGMRNEVAYNLLSRLRRDHMDKTKYEISLTMNDNVENPFFWHPETVFFFLAFQNSF